MLYLMSVLHLINSVCELWIGAEVCAYRLPSSYFWMNEWMCATSVRSHGSKRRHEGSPVRSANTPAFSSKKLHIQQPKNRERLWLRGCPANFKQMALLFTCLHIPSPNSLNLLGAFFLQPHGNSKSCQQTWNFLMMSPELWSYNMCYILETTQKDIMLILR